jgi:hypothetical protein
VCGCLRKLRLVTHVVARTPIYATAQLEPKASEFFLPRVSHFCCGLQPFRESAVVRIDVGETIFCYVEHERERRPCFQFLIRYTRQPSGQPGEMKISPAVFSTVCGHSIAVY